MDTFVVQLETMRLQLENLSSEEQEVALDSLTSVVDELKEARLRRQIQEKAQQNLAHDTEKMIMERYANDWSMLDLDTAGTSRMDIFSTAASAADELSTSATHRTNDRRTDDDDEADDHQLPTLEFSQTSVNDQIEHWLSQDFRADTDQPGPSNVYEDSMEGRLSAILSDQRSLASPSHDLRRPRLSRADSEGDGRPRKKAREESEWPATVTTSGGKENRDVCASCGYVARNRKALWRHGQKEQHPVREAKESGKTIQCGMCDFTTMKKFNYDRHLQRHHFVIRNHVCDECGLKFKDRDTLKGHIKNMHASS